MHQFYVSIIFLGITLIVLTLVWIMFDKKKSQDYFQQLEEKKADLLEIITDAEQMVEELNKFSDYIVTQMDLKNEEINANLKSLEERIVKVSEKVQEKNEIRHISNEKVVNGDSFAFQMKPEVPLFNFNSELSIENIRLATPNAAYSNGFKASARTSEKVIHLNSKHKEVLMLADRGLSETDIAKKLNLGRGEIQLIMQMNK